VVQYAQNGSVINHWNLKSKTVRNESQSDGIYFVSPSGAVVHLSGHYIFVQNPTPADLKRLVTDKQSIE